MLHVMWELMSQAYMPTFHKLGKRKMNILLSDFGYTTKENKHLICTLYKNVLLKKQQF
jgi:hypothetical protein